MTRISKVIKDQNPEVYGYGSPLQIPGNEDGTIRSYYVGFTDADGDIRFCPATKELYEWDRNERRKENQYKDRRSRCMVPSKKYGLKICECNCDECPFGLDKRIPSTESMDYLYDNYEMEFADKAQPSIVEVIIKEERDRALEIAVSNIKPEDRIIIELFKKDYTDDQIASEIGEKRSTVQYRRQRIFDELREQLKDF